MAKKTATKGKGTNGKVVASGKAARVKAVKVETSSQIMLLPSPQKVGKLQAAAEKRLATAEDLEIRDDEEFKLAGLFALSIKETEQMVGEIYDEHVKKAHELHKGLTSAKKKLLDPLSEARKIVQEKLSAWTREQVRIANEKAAKEQQKLIKQAEKSGDQELVQDLKEEEVAVPVAAVVEKQVGVIQKTVIRYRIVNELKIPRTFLMVDESKIKAHIAKHGITAQIDGVEVYEDVQTQIRG